MWAATEGNLPPIIPRGSLVAVLGREVRKGLPGELMVESFPSRQRQPPCKTNKEITDEAADTAVLTYLLTYLLIEAYLRLFSGVANKNPTDRGKFGTAKIKLKPNPNIYCHREYQLQGERAEAMKKLLMEFIELGWIEPSNS